MELARAEREETNIEKLTDYLSKIDQNLFPEKPLEIKEVQMEAPASHNYEKDQNGNIKIHYYGINKNLNEAKDDNDYSIFDIATHEVRHRVQLEKLDKNDLFTRENLNELDSLKYGSLKNSEKNEKILTQLNKLIKDIDPEDKMSGNDYDAFIIASFAKLLKRNNIPPTEIAQNIIAKSREDIIKKLEELSK